MTVVRVPACNNRRPFVLSQYADGSVTVARYSDRSGYHHAINLKAGDLVPLFDALAGLIRKSKGEQQL
ncbi:hypothetical protein [Mycolicibacterium neoaurum]|uniref:hypothetical protein n=1 Tax=Mycolicibacterium neoaurum TaxID=1795 RepID=UPI001F4D1279|nr:hypothetical protein [Mycolicibacterium neoaurum]